MFGYAFCKSLNNRLFDKKLIEVDGGKTKLLNCDDDDINKLYNGCFNRKQRRIVLKQYLKLKK